MAKRSRRKKKKKRRFRGCETDNWMKDGKDAAKGWAVGGGGVGGQTQEDNVCLDADWSNQCSCRRFEQPMYNLECGLSIVFFTLEDANNTFRA